MTIAEIIKSCPLAADFFQPLLDLLAGADNQRSCPKISDADWLLLLLHRTLEAPRTGRGYLQTFSDLVFKTPTADRFFEALGSSRRQALIKEINEALVKQMTRVIPDAFAEFPSLEDFEIYAGDGHFHAAAVHDPRDANGKRHATGHVFMLNLRTEAMRHLDLCDPLSRKKEHDMHVLKRQEFETLRGGAPKGRKVIIAYDRAALDFGYWHRAKATAGVYFISRPKSNTRFEECGYRTLDPKDAANEGIVSDEQGGVGGGRMIRRITWINPDDGAHYVYLTNEMTLAPGLLVLIFRRRWDEEKVFDEFKNKLDEQKSWGSSLSAKTTHANALCLLHNLMVLYEKKLAKEHGIENEAEVERRAKQLAKRTAEVEKVGRKMPAIIRGFQRLTVRSVKFVRWLRKFMFFKSPLDAMYASLRTMYAVL